MATQTVVRKEITVPSNGQVDNALSGTDLEFAPGSGQITPFISAGSQGIDADLRTPNNQVANQASLGSSNNNPPLLPDDLFAGAYMVTQGERSILRLVNTTASDVEVYIYFQYEA